MSQPDPNKRKGVMPNDLKNKLNRFYDTYNDNRCSGLCQDLLRRRQIRQRINVVCCGQLKLATALEFFQYRFSDSFGGNPPLYSCGLSAL
ncbi:hypothetical protein [Citrobacter portucalensis]|uniref:hypothetical protein n=1 Tax=Citrobacter portucalensis TaxID=1639133 RepID=UPI00254AC345|nr:hypothetical protein [Citrobacter portucalensis]